MFKRIQPIFSADREEAKHRVISLYKAWYRQIPFIGEFDCDMQILTAAAWYQEGVAKIIHMEELKLQDIRF